MNLQIRIEHRYYMYVYVLHIIYATQMNKSQ